MEAFFHTGHPTNHVQMNAHVCSTIALSIQKVATEELEVDSIEQ